MSAVLVLLAAVVILFFTLTRTEVGRDQLRREAEVQFGNAFEGRLEIDHLTGNLLRDLFASGVRLRDEDGNVIVTVDSVVVRPRWRDLFSRSLSFGEITLVRPEVVLERTEAGNWTVEDALRPRRARSGGGTAAPWSFSSAEVQVFDGRFRTVNRGGVPDAVAAGRLFDYANAEVENIDALGEVVWTQNERSVQIDRLSARWADEGLRLHLFDSAFRLEEDAAIVESLTLSAGDLRLVASGAYGSPTASRQRGWGQAAIELNIDAAHLAFDDLRRFFPAIPLRDAVDAEGIVDGTLASLRLDGLEVARGASRVQIAGSVTGLPDSAAYRLKLSPSTLTATDIQAVAPQLDARKYAALGTVRARADLRGTYVLPRGEQQWRLASTSDLTIRSAAGDIAGKVVIAGGAGRQPLVELALRLDGVDPAPVLQNAELAGRLSGSVKLNVSRWQPEHLTGALALQLTESTFAGRRIDSLSVRGEAREGALDALVLLQQGTGRLSARGNLQLAASQPRYHAEVRASRVDLGRLLLTDSLSTALNGTLSVDGESFRLAALRAQATLSLDSSRVTVGGDERYVAPGALSAELVQTGEAPHFTLAGDAGDVSLTGDVSVEPLLALVRQWQAAVAIEVARELNKPRSQAGILAAEATALRSDDAAHVGGLRARSLRVLDRAGRTGAMNLALQVRLKESGLLGSLFPAIRYVAPGTAAEAELTIGPDNFELAGSARTDSAGTSGAYVRRAQVTFGAGMDTLSAGPARFGLSVRAAADTVRAVGRRYADAKLDLNIDEGVGDLELTARNTESEAALRLDAGIALLPDRNRITLRTLQAFAGSSAWRNAGTYTLDLFEDALVVPALTLASRSQAVDVTQRITLSGALSSAEEDTVLAVIENLSVRQVSEALHLKYAVGGLLDGRLAYTGGRNSPVVTGFLNVPVLIFEDQAAGRLEITSRFIPGSPDIGLHASLLPLSDADPSLRRYMDFTRRTVRRVRENAFQIDGTFRLPRRAAPGAPSDGGALDLTLAVDRLDLFFFESIFPGIVSGVTGYADGGGRVGGTLRKPDPDLHLTLHDGNFDIPEFGLSYAAAGDVRIVPRGIMLDDAAVTDDTGGTAVVGGGILFNDFRFLSFDLRAALDEMQIIDVLTSDHLSFYGRIWASGDATLTGPVSNALLSSGNARASARSEIFIPLSDNGSSIDPSFIVFADSAAVGASGGRRPAASAPARKRTFLDGLEMDLGIYAPPGSTIHLVIDPLLGDVINAVGSGRLQLQLREGEFFTFGSLDVTSGDYLFTAGDVFFRRFLIDSGKLTWDGDPVDAILDIEASYRTRASLAGLTQTGSGMIPLIVKLDIGGRLSSLAIGLELEVDRRDRGLIANYEGLEAAMNTPELAAEYATSVLLTNSFLLTTSRENAIGRAGENTSQIAFNSLSQLVTSQINRYVNQVLPNLDLNLGVQQGDRVQDLDITYGVALRLLDERVVIRGEGVYLNQNNQSSAVDGTQGEFMVQFRLSEAVALEVFYRRETDPLSTATLTSTTGAGLSYQTQFPTWRALTNKLFGWLLPNRHEEERAEPVPVATEG